MSDRLIQIQHGATHGSPQRFAVEFLGALFGEEGFEHGQLIGGRWTREAATEGVGEAGVVVVGGGGDDGFGHGLGGFHEHLVIQQREGLQRAVGDIALGEAGFAGGGVEGGGHGEGRGALREGVEAAAIAVFALAGLPLKFPVGALGGDAGWLRRIHAGAAHFRRENARGFQSGVADDLGIEAETCAATEQDVLGVCL